jgi:hypothetical protein
MLTIVIVLNDYHHKKLILERLYFNCWYAQNKKKYKKIRRKKYVKDITTKREYHKKYYQENKTKIEIPKVKPKQSFKLNFDD